MNNTRWRIELTIRVATIAKTLLSLVGCESLALAKFTLNQVGLRLRELIEFVESEKENDS